MSRQRNQYWQLFVFLVVVSLTLILGDQRGWWNSFRGLIETRIVARRVNHTETDKQKISQLESKITSLENTTKNLEDENTALRKQLEAPLPPKLHFIPGYVISLEVTADDAFLKAAAGGTDGVKKGMGVLSETMLVGFVTDVTPRISTIQLLSSSKSRVSVATSNGAKGLVVGTDEKDRPDMAIIDRVLQTEPLTVGDKIITSGEDDIPPNLLIGEVSEILSESRDPFQRAKITLYAKPRDLKRIFIIGNEQ